MASPGRPLRLLQVLGYAGAGGRGYGITGVERVVQVLLDGLDPQRFEHYLAYPRRGELHARYLPHARAILAAEPRQRYDPAFVGALVRFVREHGIDLVVSHGLRFDFHAALACRRARVPHLVVRAIALADEPMSGLQKTAYGLIDAWTLRTCRRVVAVSEASKRRMLDTQHLGAAKITVIPNGVRMPQVGEEERRTARRALGVRDDEVLVGGVGQLIPRKAFHLLVEALAALRSRHPESVGVLLGEGPERARLEALARARAVRLFLPGYRDDPYPAMAAFDVAVLPSRAEGMPLVVLEAMGLGVACVATPAAGTAELIEDGRSGLLVPLDDVPSLAAAIGRLLDDPALRARVATAGMQRVRANYGLEAMLGRFAQTLWAAAGWSAP